METRKKPTEKDILQRLSSGGLRLAPLKIELMGRDLHRPDVCIDARIRISWGRTSADFVVEVGNRYTPSAIMQAKETVRRIAAMHRSLPMLVVPYLSPDRIDELASEGMSAIDLCGNGVVVVPGKILVLRTGKPNQFPEPRTPRSLYRGQPSLVSRTLLARPEFESLNDLSSEIKRLGGSLSLASVSKTVTALAEELIVTKEGRRIRLVQPELLLNRLRESYAMPEAERKVSVKSSLSAIDLRRRLTETAKERDTRIAATGTSSAERYAVLAQSGPLSVYCGDIDLLLEDIPYEESPWFPDLELIQTTNQSVYFDTRQDDDFIWASPIQAYLELMGEDARAQSIAVVVRQCILEEIAQWK